MYELMQWIYAYTQLLELPLALVLQQPVEAINPACQSSFSSHKITTTRYTEVPSERVPLRERYVFLVSAQPTFQPTSPYKLAKATQGDFITLLTVSV